MLLSYVAIANLALGHIGEDDRISDPDEQSRAARIIKRAWEPTRLFVLADAHWSFAARTLELSARPVMEEWPIALGRTAYPLPADLVNLIEIVNPDIGDDDDEFAIETGPNGQELLVDYSGAITIRYVRDGAEIRDPARWSAGFAKAFAFQLAWQIADGLSADKGRKDRALSSYASALSKAKKANARTKPFRRNQSGDWVRARMGGRASHFASWDKDPS